MAVQLHLDRRTKRYLRRHYTPGQRMVIRNITAEARRRVRAPGSEGGRHITRSERRLAKSAFETGRIESTFRNLGYGDADSQGWRQERAMYYSNPRDVPASVKRYFNEAAPFAKRGYSAHAIAQAAQQSAYPERYKTAEGEATSLFKALVKGQPAPGGGHGGGGASAAAAGTPQSLRALIGGGPQSTPVAGSGPPDPEFSARQNLKLPELAGEVPSSDVPTRSSGPDLGDLRRLLASAPTTSPVPSPGGLGGPGGAIPPGGITISPGRGRPVPLNPARFQVGKSGKTAVLRRGPHRGEVVAWEGGRWKFARSGRPVKGLRWRPQGGQHSYANAMFAAPKGTVYGAPIDRPGMPTKPLLRHFTRRLAGSLGKPITFGTGSQHNRMTTSGNVSDHWEGRGIDLPMEGTKLKHAGAHALRLLGVSKPKARQMAAAGGAYTVQYKGHRFQVIFRTTIGGNHWNHLHVGFA